MARHEDRRDDCGLALPLAGGLSITPLRLILAALLAAALAVPASAAADTPQDFSAADQYVETLPTTSGPDATGDDRRGSKTPLRPSVAAKLRAQGGADAARLEAVATSSDFGAPQGKAGGADKENDSGDRRDSRTRAAVPSASVQAVQGNAEDLLWLLLALVAITGLMAGAVFYQRHRHKDST
jgi:opacity protein-like surface antigen